MKRVLICLFLFFALLGNLEAKTCITKKPAIAISDVDDYFNMVFVAQGGEQATLEYARELIKRGKATTLAIGERVNVVDENKGASIINLRGSIWILPSGVLECK